MRLPHRLSRREQQLPDPGCPGCSARRGWIVLVEADRLADGSVVVRDQEPAACGLGGVVPEEVVKLIVTIAGVPDQLGDAAGDNTERA